jgi:hypothetical protein
MRVIAFFLAGFLAAAYVAIPRMAASDPEPMGAEASLYLFSLLASLAGAGTFWLLTQFQVAWREAATGFTAGALSAGVFLLTLALTRPEFPLAATLTGAFAASAAMSAALAWAFRRGKRERV